MNWLKIQNLSKIFFKDIRAFGSFSNPLFFQMSPILMAEPLKKKKRLDPAVIKAREDRNKRRLEKQIRKLQKNAQQLKPIDECEIPLEIVQDQTGVRARPKKISRQILNERFLLNKDWCRYKHKRYLDDVQMIDRLVYSQQKALDELKLENETLYLAAIETDETLFPFSSHGPVETPPIENYDSPDGDYLDISKKWE